MKNRLGKRDDLLLLIQWKIKLQWGGTVFVGQCEEDIMGGLFQGETDFGNPRKL